MRTIVSRRKEHWLPSTIPTDEDAKTAERLLAMIETEAVFAHSNGAAMVVLRAALKGLMDKKIVSVNTIDEMLTTGQAADLLNVSRPYVVKLIKEGKIPSVMVGSHHKVRFVDAMTYREQRRKVGAAALQSLCDDSQAAGEY